MMDICFVNIWFIFDEYCFGSLRLFVMLQVTAVYQLRIIVYSRFVCYEENERLACLITGVQVLYYELSSSNSQHGFR